MEPDAKKQLLLWFVFILFLSYILIWLVTLFGLPPSVLKMIFNFPSYFSKYLLVDYKGFGKDEVGGMNDEIDNAKKKK